MEKARLFRKIIFDGLSMTLIVTLILIAELKVRHIKKFLLGGLSLSLLIGAFLIQDMFASLWKIPIALVMLLSANAVFQRLKNTRKASQTYKGR